jgi:Holliday junction DNA helicase RuvA
MIAYIEGKVIQKDSKSLIVLTGGIGYKIHATFEIIEKRKLQDEVKLFVYHAIREDAQDLFGFETKEDKDVFELLIGISGIGPKTALGILNVTTVESLRRAVTTNDSSHLIKVSGIGKKNAEKIVLELKGKLGEGEEMLSLKDEVDALEALKSLGFGHKEAREVLRSLPAHIISTESRVKEALKLLSK